MGMMRRRRRRRLLVAGAATAGVAHHYGKKAGEEQAYEDQQASSQDQDTAYAPAPPEDAGPSAGDLEEIEKLGELHKSGVLTDEEFSAAKAKLLA